MISDIRTLAVAGLVAVLLPAASASAVTAMSSSSYGLSVDLRLANFVGVGLGPVATAGGNAPAAYNDLETALAVNSRLSLGVVGLVSQFLDVRTGVLNAAASSTFPGNAVATASSSVDGLTLATGTRLFGRDTVLATFGTGVLTSTATIDANGTLSASGASNITDLSGLSALLGLNLNVNGLVNAAPNTILFSALGLTIIANEQITMGDGINALGIEVNALRISFNNLALGLGLLNGDIIVAHSEASVIGEAVQPPVGGVPEPASWALMIAGFGLVGAGLRRRRADLAAA